MVPAAYVGWSRVDLDLHHVRDVVAGCAVGVIAGLWFTQPLEGDTQIMPFYDQKVFGVNIQSRW
jgi:membrane-associated phospholipid phosphatase